MSEDLVMIKDWLEANAGVVKIENGKCRPQVVYSDWGDQIVYGADEDGLVATLVVDAADGSRSMLTALFPMKYKEAVKRTKAGDFPLKPNQTFTVVELIDRVTGDSGERYCRFKIIPMDGEPDHATAQ